MNELSYNPVAHEASPCYRCPLLKRPNLLARFLGLEVRAGATFNYCHGKGPETEVVSGAVEVDYRSGQVSMEREDRKVCPIDMTPERYAFSTSQQSLIYDRYEEAISEVERREEDPGSLTPFEQQTVINRIHIPPVKVLN